MKRRSYSYDVDTESDKDEVADTDNGSGNDGSENGEAGNDEAGNDGSDNGEADGNSNEKFVLSPVNYEPRVTLGDMIADLDDSEGGTAFLNVLEAYVIFMIALYLFFVIS